MKILRFTYLIIALFIVTACTNVTSPLFLNKPYRFVKDEALEVLAVEDDYMVQLSAFDYKTKFGLEEIPEDYELIAGIYYEALLDWNEEEIDRISRALSNIEVMLDGYTFKMPDELWLINEDGSIEGGAAYTRGNAIILPRGFISRLDSKGLEELILHELFHVISRYNKELRPEIYGIINYHQCENLLVEGDLASRLIANPDAPDLNYYINCHYKDELVSFIPILYSEKETLEPYESFFTYLRDDMMAVNIIDGVPRPILDDQGAYKLVSKENLDDYYELIGRNTSYTFHPEETMADNFVAMVLRQDDTIPDPWILERLRKLLSE